MRFFNSAAGNAPAAPSTLTNVVNLTPPYSASLTAVFPSNYSFGRGATGATVSNQVCATSTNVCQAFTPPQTIVSGVQLIQGNSVAPLATGPSGRVYWNVRVINNLGYTAIYQSQSTATIVP